MFGRRLLQRTAPTLSTFLDRFSSVATEQLTLSENFVSRIKQLQKQRSSNVALRIHVDGGGCSGFQYGFELENWDEKPTSNTLKNVDDKLFERDGACVIVDNLSLLYIAGSQN